MRTNIDIDDELMADTLKWSGKSTKKAAVEEAMRSYIKSQEFSQFLEETRGIGWNGNLDDMRRDLDEQPGLDIAS